MLRYLSIDKPVRYWCLDETRLGLKTLTGRLITLAGVKPEGQVQWKRQNFYLYGAVEPLSGAHFFWEFSHLDSTCFQHFLDQLAQAFPDTLNLLQMDNGSFHKSTTLQLPANVLPIFQPAHSPELNPIERLWQHIKQALSWEQCKTLDELRKKVSQVLESVTSEIVSSICGWDYITAAVLSATS